MTDLTYLPVHFHLRFGQPAFADAPPLFVLRSVLGRNLRSMSCVAEQAKCGGCMYGGTCAYSFLFETILSQENEILPGRDKGSHPFALTKGRNIVRKKISDYDFTLTLIGRAGEYLPYIYSAFAKAGKDGLFKSRTPFEIADVTVGGKSILVDSEHIDASVPALRWKFDNDLQARSGEVLLEMNTPLRFKYNGKYGTDFTAENLMLCMYRRMKTICSLYGNADEILEYSPDEEIRIAERKLSWLDCLHYSARQRNAMSLGGVTGTLKLSGTFSPMVQNLLEFSRLFNAGKSTNFGLGQMDFWNRWE